MEAGVSVSFQRERVGADARASLSSHSPRARALQKGKPVVARDEP